MSALGAEFEDLFVGRPDEIDPRAQALIAAADAIAQATDALRDLVDGQTSEATDALARTASEVARSLSKARVRYRKTGEALQTYAADLRPIQRDARSAVSNADYYEQKSFSLPSDISRREGDLLRAEAVEAPQSQIDVIQDDIWRLRQAESRAYGEVEESRRALYAARDRLRVIADDAMSKIETASEGEKDSAADNWNQFWDAAAGWIGDWAASVLKGILEFLGELLAVLVAIIVVILLLIIVALVIAVIIATGGMAPLAFLALVAAAIVAGLLLTFILRESRDPKGPAINEARGFPYTKNPSDSDDAESADEFTAEDYGDLFEEVGRQDAAGGENSTVIRVVAITDADGNIIGYRVQLPSTQNWGPGNENGALNDLSADAMLAMFPGLKTQYEKAVWDAMERAGVFENDVPIMLTGWSLGGMMAGDLATDPRISGRVESVVTAGSAIDKHAGEMDPSVRVTQVNNRWDPVHTLEFVGYDDDDVPGPNWQTYRPTDIRIHDSGMYGELADDLVPGVRPGDEVFFADDVDGSYEQVYEMEYSRG